MKPNGQHLADCQWVSIKGTHNLCFSWNVTGSEEATPSLGKGSHHLPPTLKAPRICGLLPFTAEKAMAPHSSTLAWKIPWMEEPGKLQSMGSQSQTRLSDFTFTFHFHALEKEMATHSSVLAWRIPGTAGPGGLSSMGLHRVGHD